jgi:hypothetical protein
VPQCPACVANSWAVRERGRRAIIRFTRCIPTREGPAANRHLPPISIDAPRPFGHRIRNAMNEFLSLRLPICVGCNLTSLQCKEVVGSASYRLTDNLERTNPSGPSPGGRPCGKIKADQSTLKKRPPGSSKAVIRQSASACYQDLSRACVCVCV